MTHKMIRTILTIIVALTLSCANAQDRKASYANGTKVRMMSTGNIGSNNAVTAFLRLQQLADEHYTEKRYKKAFEEYESLAEYNDKFSQYRLGLMYVRGYGVDKDMLKAYAWTYLSAETQQSIFTEYHFNIRKLMTEEELAKGRELANKYLRKYGTFAVASKARALFRKAKRECTGSRVGRTCDRIASGGIYCGHVSQGDISRKCLTLGAVGVPAVVGTQPAAMRRAEIQIDAMVDQYNPGRVELRDLEVIED